MKPYYETDNGKLYNGDVLEVLKSMESGIVQCVVTSPPYWGLRDYGTAEWEVGADLSTIVLRLVQGNEKMQRWKEAMERAHEEGKMETANEKKWRLKADQLVRDMEVMDKAFKVRIQELEEDIHALIGYSPRHCIDCPIDIDGVCLCGLNNLKAKYEPPKH